MESVPLVKMSAKGQLVVPEDIRDKEGFHEGDRFMPVSVVEGVLFKRVAMPTFEEFERFSKEMRAHARKHKITKKTIDEALRWARQSSS
ncbi:MAG: hypothetical protein AABY13_05800 [Nanoarchaeota archaeon]